MGEEVEEGAAVPGAALGVGDGVHVCWLSLHFLVGVVVGVVSSFLFLMLSWLCLLALEVCSGCLDPNTNPMAL